jgi:uncharacterized membrane protein YeaQ/YmgE (transglycosylase-associated protein family)
MENILFLVIAPICGVIGAKVATTVMKILSLGVTLNILIGIIGGLAGAALLHLLGVQAISGFKDFPAIINTASVSGIAGGVLMTLIGVFKISLKNSAGQKSNKHYA